MAGFCEGLPEGDEQSIQGWILRSPTGGGQAPEAVDHRPRRGSVAVDQRSCRQSVSDPAEGVGASSQP